MTPPNKDMKDEQIILGIWAYQNLQVKLSP